MRRSRPCVAIAFFLIWTPSTLAGKQPNILLIVTDQERAPPAYEPAAWADYRQKYFKGRNAIAAHGMSFKEHYITSSACVPSRACIYTGQHLSLHGVDQTTGLGKEGDDPGLNWLVPGYVPTIGDYMRAAGYDSSYIGKWHISEEDISIDGQVVAGGEDLDQITAYKKQDLLDKYGFNNWIGPEPHGTAPENSGTERDPGYVEQAVDWIRRRDKSRNDTPFFLALNLVNPHDICMLAGWPLFEKAINDGTCPKSSYGTPTIDEDLAATGKPSVQQQYKKVLDTSDFSAQFRRLFYTQEDEECFYYFLMKTVDEHIWQVYETLRQTAFYENTIVVLTADHGELLGSHGLVQKWHNAYQESLHVPFVVSNPRMFPAASVNHPPVLPDSSTPVVPHAVVTPDAGKPETPPQTQGENTLQGGATPPNGQPDKKIQIHDGAASEKKAPDGAAASPNADPTESTDDIKPDASAATTETNAVETPKMPQQRATTAQPALVAPLQNGIPQQPIPVQQIVTPTTGAISPPAGMALPQGFPQGMPMGVQGHVQFNPDQQQTLVIPAQGPFFALDVQSVATGYKHGDRNIGQIAIIDEGTKIRLNVYVKPAKTVVNYIYELTSLRREVLDRYGMPEDKAKELVLQVLPPQCVLVGQNIEQDIQALGLIKGKHYRDTVDLSEVWKVYNPQYHSFTKFTLAHEARHLLNVPTNQQRNAVYDAMLSMQLFHLYVYCQRQPKRGAGTLAWYRTILLNSLPAPKNFIKRYPIYEGVCMGSRKHVSAYQKYTDDDQPDCCQPLDMLGPSGGNQTRPFTADG